MAGVQFTERLTMHLNGGSKYSELHYRIYADGQETGITHHRRTGGRPKYLITDDRFYCKQCKGEWDRLTSGAAGLFAWLAEHARPHDAGPAAGEDQAPIC